MTSMIKALFLGCIVLLSAGLSACGSGSGFHLRGAESGNRLQDVTIVVQGGTGDFQAMLGQTLKRQGARIVTESNGGLLVRIQDVKSSRLVSGYSVTRAVSEFKYQMQVDFSIYDYASKETRFDSVTQTQTQAYDSDYVLGTQEEAEQIQQDLQREVVRLVALKIAATR